MRDIGDARLEIEEALGATKGGLVNAEWAVPTMVARFASPSSTGRLMGGASSTTNHGREFAIGDFEVSADGRGIIFDRAREESDIVLFDLPGR